MNRFKSFLPLALSSGSFLFYACSSQKQASENGFTDLFNGKNLDGWIGNGESYRAESGMIVIDPQGGGGGNLYTEQEYGNFVLRFEFQLTPGANNGMGMLLSSKTSELKKIK